jgi:hypothetical protein
MEKYKISSCGLPNLQIAPCDIKNDSRVYVVRKNDNLLTGVNFRPQFNQICLVVMSSPIKMQHMSLFNKYIYKHIK